MVFSPRPLTPALSCRPSPAPGRGLEAGANIPSPLRGRGWPASAGRVRGRRESLLNLRPDPVQIFENVVVPEADDSETLAFEKGRSLGIPFRRMLASVNFDDEAERGTQEIYDVAVDLNLAPELDADVLTGAKNAPQLSLGVSRVPAQRLRPAGQMMPPCHYAPSPRRCRADPLPRRGEGFSGTVNA